MVQYRFTCLVWFRKIITWHLHAFIYFCLIILECEFGAIILCVDFGASGDCDCEDYCYSPNYQGKWCFMYLSYYFLLCTSDILYRACMKNSAKYLYAMTWEILVVVVLVEFSL